MAARLGLLQASILTACLCSLSTVLHGESTFTRGDFNDDGAIDIADPVSVLIHLFGGAPAACLDAGDANDDGLLDITDAVHVLHFLFLGSPPPALPFPDCGADSTFDDLGCAASRRCPPVENRIVAIRRVPDGIEIELTSSMPFPARALLPVLCIGGQTFMLGRFGDFSGATLIFLLTEEELARLRDGDLVTVQHGGCTEDLAHLRLYWDLWIFGPLDLSLLGG